jgi:hypothetical protein
VAPGERECHKEPSPGPSLPPGSQAAGRESEEVRFHINNQTMVIPAYFLFVPLWGKNISDLPEVKLNMD